MNLNLTPEEISDLKVQFQAWQEVNERAKELRDEKAGICETAARIFDGKKTEANKLFKAMQELWEGEEAEVNELSSMLEIIQHNGNS